ncbi:MAG: tripartite tricarboxylate transporter TctB family protein [candidate division NC10 bacterium]|nr:tripartite tricarboxylate transporter TctB family protein [candidate division NC10 bacterium]
MPPISLKKVDSIASLLVIPICLYVFYESGTWPIPPDMGNPAWIPRGVAVVLLAAALLMLSRALTGRALFLESRLEGADRARVLWVAALTGVYVILLERLGFMATTGPYLFGFGMVVGERRWVRLALFALAVPVATYLLFDVTLNVPLPRGWLR